MWWQHMWNNFMQAKTIQNYVDIIEIMEGANSPPVYSSMNVQRMLMYNWKRISKILVEIFLPLKQF